MTSKHHLKESVAYVLCHCFVAFSTLSQRRQLRRVRMWGETPSRQRCELVCITPDARKPEQQDGTPPEGQDSEHAA